MSQRGQCRPPQGQCAVEKWTTGRVPDVPKWGFLMILDIVDKTMEPCKSSLYDMITESYDMTW